MFNDPVQEKVMEKFNVLETLFFSGEFGIIHALKSDNDRTIAEPYQIDDKRLERVNPNADRVIKHNRERSSYRQRAEIKQSIATLDARIEQARELAELIEEYAATLETLPRDHELFQIIENRREVYRAVIYEYRSAVAIYREYMEEQRHRLIDYLKTGGSGETVTPAATKEADSEADRELSRVFDNWQVIKEVLLNKKIIEHYRTGYRLSKSGEITYLPALLYHFFDSENGDKQTAHDLIIEYIFDQRGKSLNRVSLTKNAFKKEPKIPLSLKYINAIKEIKERL
jgi:hypothetical protein